jgi:aspartate oxidase
MEQVQFYPTMMFEPVKAPISNPLFGAGAVLRNGDKERFMEHYDSAGDMATRDNMARAIFLEIQAGRGVDGCVYMDCTSIPPDQLKELYKDFYHFLLAAKLDPTKDFLKVSPCVHYFLGGIVIDENAATNIPGLYAAGEICGGIHGANRLSGAALMEACVFGWQAGISAASQITKNITHPESILPAVSLGGKPDEKYSTTIRTLRTMMWENVSLIRSEKSLQQMNVYIDHVLQQLKMDSNDVYDLSLRSMLNVAKAVTLSALARKESRGAHFRSDYSQTSAEFDGNIYCRKKGDSLEAEFVSGKIK